MNLDKFKKLTVAINTPFNDDGSVKYEAIGELIDYLYNKGVRNLYVCGSTGEGFLLDDNERMKVAEKVIDSKKSDMSIILHVGTPGTYRSIKLAEHAEKIGVDAVSAVPCVYYRPSEKSVYEHWMGIVRASKLPFFIYNIPQLTGFNLSMNLFNEMIKDERVCGIKCSSDPVHDVMRFKQAGGENFLVYTGSDEQYLAGRLFGAEAGIGGTYAAMPELYLRLEELIKENKIEEAKELQGVITPLIYRLCSFPSLYGAVKSLIAINGCDIGNPRLPFLPVDKKDPELIKLDADIKDMIGKYCK